MATTDFPSLDLDKDRRIFTAPGFEEGDICQAAVLILAHNEEAVIGNTVRSVVDSLSGGDTVIVIADNCSDGTSMEARKAGALVLVRSSGGPDGKGAALKWFAETHLDLMWSFRVIVILDADSWISPDFLITVKSRHIENTVMQCLVQPINYDNSPLSTLIALSELLEQQTLDRIRDRLGWPVRLRGVGMVITPAILAQTAGRLGTEVEDIALTLLIASAGFRIVTEQQAIVYDPKPENAILASRQRARWFRGQWAALWTYRQQVANLILRGPAGWSLLMTLFVKPRWLLDSILLIATVMLLWVSPLLSVTIACMLLFDLCCLSYTILQTKERGRFMSALLHFPAFLVMWLRSFLLTFKRNTWLRARE